MQRDLVALNDKAYDVLVIGGGIHGACVAWEAQTRGLSVALVEKSDFASATSANSLKTIHGGLRYLQHADFMRMRESMTERKTLMRIAPHLIHPLPVLVPTYGHGMKSKAVMAMAMVINDLMSWDRNHGMDSQKHLPRGRIISKQECLRLAPGIKADGLSGGAIFYDAQVYNSERFTLTFLRSAESVGACLANYVEVTGFLRHGNTITGVQAYDHINGECFDIRARIVINTSGPWFNRVIGLSGGVPHQESAPLAKCFNLVLRRQLFSTCAVGFSASRTRRDADAISNKSSRLLFVAPWREYSIIGTENIAYDGDPNDFRVTEEEIWAFLSDFNQAYPAAHLDLSDVSLIHSGLLPARRVKQPARDVHLTKHYRILDHRKDGVAGLLSVVSVKYTTARSVAEKAIDRVFKIWDQNPPDSASAKTGLYGGDIEKVDEYLQAETRKRPARLSENGVQKLILNYGSAYAEVLQYMPEHGDEQHAMLEAMTVYGIRKEMALKLSDIVCRRTELGSAGHPGKHILQYCAEAMRREMKWSLSKMKQELEEVDAIYPVASAAEARNESAWIAPAVL
jgi:glycerol-3-phosphate dehydrogenase